MKKVKRVKPKKHENDDIEQMALSINQLLQKADSLEMQLNQLESIKKQMPENKQKPAPVDVYKDFCSCQRVCRPVPRVNRCEKLAGSEQNVLGQIMDLINDIRSDVSVLATKQNQMREELEKIRVKLC